MASQEQLFLRETRGHSETCANEDVDEDCLGLNFAVADLASTLSLSHCWSSVNDVASVQAVCTVGSTLIVSLSAVMTIAEIN